MRARVLVFLAFATYSALRWSALVAYPPVARTLVVVGLVTLAGMGVASLRPWPGRPWATALARLALIAVAGAAAMVVMGLSPRFLLPSGWSELSDGVGRGILALEIRDWPYAGSDGWVRMTVLLVMPVVLTIAAAFAFWPARRFRGTFRIAAAALLVGLYAVASVQHEPLTPLPSGPVLLALLSAWLFLPEGPRRRAPGAVGMVAAAGCIALPLAAILPATNPVINYRALALGQRHHFLWNQTYGPIDWPRDRDVVLTVDSPEPHYWKAVTLDEFDGERWVLSGKDDGAHPLAELPNAGSDRWRADATVTVDSIDSSALFAPGPILGTQGLESVSIADDGTALTSDDLGPGDSYVIHAYAPDPSAAAMRRVDDGIPGRMVRYTRFALPRRRGLHGHASRRGREHDDRDAGSRRRRRPASGRPASDPGLTLRSHVPARPPSRGTRADHVRRGAKDRGVPAKHLPVRREATGAASSAGRISPPRPDRLLPAILGRDGPDAADERNPRARRGGIRTR